ncbi:glucosaminidase domain-containing protein [Myroides sp. LJL119]
MVKRVIFFVFCLALLSSCGSNKNGLTGQKVKSQRLISKKAYREELKKKEQERYQYAQQELANKNNSQEKAAGKESVKSNKTSDKTEVLTATSQVKVTTDLIADYINTYKEVAKQNMEQHGIPASITLAQGVLESGSGQGTLSRNANNHFGIKCHKEWDGPSVRHTDDAPDECFRKYDSPAESYRDHSLFLTSRSRYNSLFDLPKDDYQAWAHGLKKAGYATDPKYAEKLISLIERYSLYQYDKELLTSLGKELGNSQKVSSSNPGQTSSNAIVHIVKKGDTLYSISKKYNTSVSQVQKNNNLNGSMLSIGQVLKIK